MGARVCVHARVKAAIVGMRLARRSVNREHMSKTVIIAEKPSVAQDIVREGFHVVRSGVATALEEGVGAGGLGEGDARAR